MLSESRINALAFKRLSNVEVQLNNAPVVNGIFEQADADNGLGHRSMSEKRTTLMLQISDFVAVDQVVIKGKTWIVADARDDGCGAIVLSLEE